MTRVRAEDFGPPPTVKVEIREDVYERLVLLAYRLGLSLTELLEQLSRT